MLYQNVVGVVVFAIPYVGGAVDYLVNDERGRVFGVGLLVAVLAATFLAEGICSALTRHAANVITPGGRKKGDGGLEVKSYRSTRKARKELERRSESSTHRPDCASDARNASQTPRRAAKVAPDGAEITEKFEKEGR